MLGRLMRRLRRGARAASPPERGSPPSVPVLLESQWRLFPSHGALTIFDVGAHHGESVEAYLSVFPSAHVHAFEPVPASVAELERRYSEERRVTVHPVGLAAHEGPWTMHTGPRSPRDSMYPVDETWKHYYDSAFDIGRRTAVRLRTVDEAARGAGVEHIHILKIDTQGAELEVLKGAEGMLREARIDCIRAELAFFPLYQGGAVYWQVARYLAGFDYVIYDLFEIFHAPNGQINHCDGLFVSPSVRRSLMRLLERGPAGATTRKG